MQVLKALKTVFGSAFQGALHCSRELSCSHNLSVGLCCPACISKVHLHFKAPISEIFNQDLNTEKSVIILDKQNQETNWRWHIHKMLIVAWMILISML